ncbi:hypothetical protein JXO52_02470 [bacterium]|nr:hypothetical protein [bacterium]
MRKACIAALLFLCALSAQAQVEKGDSEVRFLFYYSDVRGGEFSAGGSGSLMVSYGYFINPALQLGLGPRLTLSSGGSGTETQVSASVFFNYNFATASKTVPYLYGEFYQMDFSPEFGEFADYSYINIGFGVRNFFSEYIALNSAISYGFCPSENSEGGLFMILTGLSFIF